MTGSTNEGKLWGGRFAGGPSPELEALSRSTHFDWRLVPYDLAGSRAHANALHARRAAHRRRPRARCSPGSTPSAAAYDDGRRCARTRPTRTCTAPSSGCCIERGRPRGRRPAARRPVAQRPGRHAVQGLPARPRAGRRRAASSTSSTRSPPRRATTSTWSCPAGPTSSTPSRCCCPTTCSPTRGRCSATSTGCATGTPAWPPTRRTARVRWPARASASTRRPWPRELGFTDSSANSIDGTAARDFVAEFAFVTAMTGVDLSRLAEEIVLWSTAEFGFVRLDDAWSTGSSIMPQKKNPDIAELARGKSGRLIGNLTGLLATLKGCRSPTTATCRRTRSRSSTPSTPSLVAAARVDRAWSPRSPSTPRGWPSSRPQGFSLATDVAEWLVREGVPFRDGPRGRRRVRTPLRGAGLRPRPSSPTSSSPRSRPRLTPARARGAHRRGLGRLAQRPRRHGARAGRASSSPSCRPRSRTLRAALG